MFMANKAVCKVLDNQIGFWQEYLSCVRMASQQKSCPFQGDRLTQDEPGVSLPIQLQVPAINAYLTCCICLGSHTRKGRVQARVSTRGHEGTLVHLIHMVIPQQPLANTLGKSQDCLLLHLGTYQEVLLQCQTIFNLPCLYPTCISDSVS